MPRQPEAHAWICPRHGVQPASLTGRCTHQVSGNPYDGGASLCGRTLLEGVARARAADVVGMLEAEVEHYRAANEELRERLHYEVEHSAELARILDRAIRRGRE